MKPNTPSGQTSINSALALVNDEVPRRAVASFTHSLGETLVLQREGWGWVLHFYAEDRYGLSYLIDGTDAARMAVESGDDPATLREKVTSPGGTTAAALGEFSEGELGTLVARAMRSASDRADSLARELLDK